MGKKTLAQLKTGRDFTDVLESNLNLTDGGTVAGAVALSSTLAVAGDATITGALIAGNQTVAAGNGSGNSVVLDADATFHFVTTATNSSHITVADGVVGQIKFITHKTRSNTTDLVITPTNFAAGATLTSNLGSRTVGLVFDGTNWQVISGEITGTAEMVIA